MLNIADDILSESVYPCFGQLNKRYLFMRDFLKNDISDYQLIRVFEDPLKLEESLEESHKIVKDYWRNNNHNFDSLSKLSKENTRRSYGLLHFLELHRIDTRSRFSTHQLFRESAADIRDALNQMIQLILSYPPCNKGNYWRCIKKILDIPHFNQVIDKEKVLRALEIQIGCTERRLLNYYAYYHIFRFEVTGQRFFPTLYPNPVPDAHIVKELDVYLSKNPNDAYRTRNVASVGEITALAAAILEAKTSLLEAVAYPIAQQKNITRPTEIEVLLKYHMNCLTEEVVKQFIHFKKAFVRISSQDSVQLDSVFQYDIDLLESALLEQLIIYSNHYKNNPTPIPSYIFDIGKILLLKLSKTYNTFNTVEAEKIKEQVSLMGSILLGQSITTYDPTIIDTIITLCPDLINQKLPPDGLKPLNIAVNNDIENIARIEHLIVLGATLDFEDSSVKDSTVYPLLKFAQERNAKKNEPSDQKGSPDQEMESVNFNQKIALLLDAAQNNKQNLLSWILKDETLLRTLAGNFQFWKSFIDHYSSFPLSSKIEISKALLKTSAVEISKNVFETDTNPKLSDQLLKALEETKEETKASKLEKRICQDLKKDFLIAFLEKYEPLTSKPLSNEELATSKTVLLMLLDQYECCDKESLEAGKYRKQIKFISERTFPKILGELDSGTGLRQLRRILHVDPELASCLVENNLTLLDYVLKHDQYLPAWKYAILGDLIVQEKINETISSAAWKYAMYTLLIYKIAIKKISSVDHFLAIFELFKIKKDNVPDNKILIGKKRLALEAAIQSNNPEFVDWVLEGHNEEKVEEGEDALIDDQILIQAIQSKNINIIESLAEREPPSLLRELWLAFLRSSSCSVEEPQKQNIERALMRMEVEKLNEVKVSTLSAGEAQKHRAQQATLLKDAIEKGYSEIVKKAIEHDPALVNYVYDDSYTPLSLAVDLNQAYITHILLSYYRSEEFGKEIADLKAKGYKIEEKDFKPNLAPDEKNTLLQFASAAGDAYRPTYIHLAWETYLRFYESKEAYSQTETTAEEKIKELAEALLFDALYRSDSERIKNILTRYPQLVFDHSHKILRCTSQKFELLEWILEQTSFGEEPNVETNPSEIKKIFQLNPTNEEKRKYERSTCLPEDFLSEHRKLLALGTLSREIREASYNPKLTPKQKSFLQKIASLQARYEIKSLANVSFEAAIANFWSDPEFKLGRILLQAIENRDLETIKECFKTFPAFTKDYFFKPHRYTSINTVCKELAAKDSFIEYAYNKEDVTLPELFELVTEGVNHFTPINSVYETFEYLHSTLLTPDKPQNTETSTREQLKGWLETQLEEEGFLFSPENMKILRLFNDIDSQRLKKLQSVFYKSENEEIELLKLYIRTESTAPNYLISDRLGAIQKIIQANPSLLLKSLYTPYHKPMVKSLRQKRNHQNKPINHRNSILCLSAQYGRMDVIDWLLKTHATTFTVDMIQEALLFANLGSRQPELDEQEKKNYEGIILKLQQTKMAYELEQAILQNDLLQVKRSLNLGLLNQQLIYSGKTPLELADECKQTDIKNYLIACGAHDAEKFSDDNEKAEKSLFRELEYRFSDFEEQLTQFNTALQEKRNNKLVKYVDIELIKYKEEIYNMLQRFLPNVNQSLFGSNLVEMTERFMLVQSIFSALKDSQSICDLKSKLLEIFADREYFLLNTDMDYGHSHSFANQLCYQIAAFLNPEAPYNLLLNKARTKNRKEPWIGPFDYGMGYSEDKAEEKKYFVIPHVPDAKLLSFNKLNVMRTGNNEIHDYQKIFDDIFEKLLDKETKWYRMGDICLGNDFTKEYKLDEKEESGLQLPLSHDDLIYLSQLSPTTKELIDYIVARDAFSRNPDALTAIENLAVGALRGSTHIPGDGTATQDNAGSSAYTAITEFFTHIWPKIPEEQRQQLEALAIDNKISSPDNVRRYYEINNDKIHLGDMLRLMNRPYHAEDDRKNDIAFCMGRRGECIKEILQANKDAPILRTLANERKTRLREVPESQLHFWQAKINQEVADGFPQKPNICYTRGVPKLSIESLRDACSYQHLIQAKEAAQKLQAEAGKAKAPPKIQNSESFAMKVKDDVSAILRKRSNLEPNLTRENIKHALLQHILKQTDRNYLQALRMELEKPQYDKVLRTLRSGWFTFNKAATLSDHILTRTSETWMSIVMAIELQQEVIKEKQSPENSSEVDAIQNLTMSNIQNLSDWRKARLFLDYRSASSDHYSKKLEEVSKNVPSLHLRGNHNY